MKKLSLPRIIHIAVAVIAVVFINYALVEN